MGIYPMAISQSEHNKFPWGRIINTYSVKQPDLYYFETVKMTSQA